MHWQHVAAQAALHVAQAQCNARSAGLSVLLTCSPIKFADHLIGSPITWHQIVQAYVASAPYTVFKKCLAACQASKKHG